MVSERVTALHLGLTAVVVAAALLSACDPPIALAGDTTLSVGVPLPVIDRPNGAPDLVTTLEVPGLLGEVKLVESDGAATGSFAFAVPEAATVAATLRVSGALRPGDADAVLAVADLNIDVGPGAESTLDANVDSYEFAVSPARPWLDLNRNGVENRADYEAGCDPAVPERFLGVSATDLQLPRDGDRAVLIVDNLLPRRVHLQIDVIDAPGVGIDVVGDAENATSLPAVGQRVVEPGQSLLVAVSFSAPNAFFSSGFLDIGATDDVDAGACGTRLTVPVRVLANVGTEPRPSLVEAPIAPQDDVGGFPADLIAVPAAAAVASGTPFLTSLSAVPSGRTLSVKGVAVPADAVFLIEIPRGGRLSAVVGAAPFDLDLVVLALDENDQPEAVLPRHPDDVVGAVGAVLPAGSMETAEIRFETAARGRDIAASRVLVVVGASGVTEARLLDVRDRVAEVAITLRTSTTPRLLARAEPALGSVAGGTVVKLLGESLASDGVLFFGHTPAVCEAPVDAGNGRQRLICTAPAGTLAVAENPVDLVYVSSAADGSERAALVDSFLYEPQPPRIDSVEPSIVVVGAGAALTISGFGFSERYAPVQLTLGGVAVAVDLIDDHTLFAAGPDLGPGTKDLSITVFSSTHEALTSTRTNAVLYIDDDVAAPVLAAVVPHQGDVAGGTQVTLTGSGFVAGAKLFVADEEANVLFVGATAIIALTPPGVPGAADVRVENPDLQGSTLDAAFSYTAAPTPPPQAFSLVPSTGSTLGGDEVTILGTAFQGSTVTFGGVGAAVLHSADGAIVARAPSHSAGLVDVVIENADGQQDRVVAGYSYVAPIVPGPQVFSLSPQTGALAGGTLVTIVGASFAEPTLTVGGSAVTPLDRSPNALVFVTPSHSAGAVDVVVTNADGQSARVQGAFLYADVPVTPTPPPQAFTLVPSTGSTVGGDEVTLLGAGFHGSIVRFGGVEAVVLNISDGAIVVSAPDHSAGVVDVLVENADGQQDSVVAGFSYLAPVVPAPQVFSLSPQTGVLAGGALVTIVGANFAEPTLTVGGAAVTPLDRSANAIVFVTPPHGAGAVDVVVTNDDAQSARVQGAFLYADVPVAPPPPPQAFTLVPSTGSTVGGDEVTILGAGFKDSSVRFGGVAAIVLDVADSAIVVRAPVHGADVVDVVIENADGQQDTVVAGYSYLTPIVASPQVFSLSPQTGALAGGTLVTILGASFDTPTLTVGGTAVAPIDVNANAIVFVSPAHAGGSVDVEVKNADGQTALARGAFAYADPFVDVNTPLVVSVTPDPAHAGVGGERLRLIGQDLKDTVAATIVAGGVRLPVVLDSIADNVVACSIDAALPEGQLVVELVDRVVGVHSSPAFQARSPVPVDLSVGGRADEGSAFTLLVDGSDLNPARLIGVRFSPLDAGSGAEVVLDTSFASETVIAVDVADTDLGRGAWVVALIYLEADGDDVVVPVDLLEVGGFCPGSRLCETCGDAIRDPGEACDTPDFDGETCLTNGFDGGQINCVGCQLDFNQCSRCGNGRKETDEQCDGIDLGGANCSNAGFAAGTLSCSSSCDFNVTQCRTCGDGVCSNGETSGNCAADCGPTCGNGSCDVAGESCHSCPRDCNRCAPYSLVLVDGGGQHAAITATLTTAIKVRLVDDVGVGVAGVPITFGIEAGDATSDTDFIVVTDSAGLASLAWVLGPRVGVHTMTLSANPADGSAVANQAQTVTAIADDVADGTIVRLAGGTGLTGTAILNSGIRSRIGGAAGLTLDGDGNPVYLDNPGGNSHITRLQLPNGVLQPIVVGGGSNVAAGTGDGGPAINAKVRNGAALSTRGREIFVLESQDSPTSDRVRVIDDAGFISTVAGGGATGQPANGDGGPATAAHFEQATDLGFDFNGDLVVIDNGTGRNHMRHVVDGGISTFTVPLTRTGTNFTVLSVSQAQTVRGPLQFLAEDLYAVGIASNTVGFGTGSHLNVCDTTTNACMATRGANVLQIARGPDGLLYTATQLTIERHDGVGGRTVIAGSTIGFSGDGGPATAAQFSGIVGLKFNADGDLFVLDAGTNNALRMIRRVARPTPPTSLTVLDGDAQSARVFGSPTQPVRVGLTTRESVGEWPMQVRGATGGQSAQATQLVFTSAQNAQAVIPLLGRAVGEQLWFTEPPLPLRRLLPAALPPTSFTVEATALVDGDNLVVNSSPIVIATAPAVGTVIAGTRLDFSSVLGSGTFSEPAIAFRGSDVFITDPPLNVVWHMDASGAVRALAGNARTSGNAGDGGPASLATVNRPAGVSVAGIDGDVLFTDPAQDRVRRVRGSDGVIVSAAGTGSTTSGGGNGTPATAAIVDTPRLVLGRPDGSFFLTDNKGVRFIDVTGVIRNIMADGTCLGGEIKATAAATTSTIALNPLTNRVLSTIFIPNAGACPIATNRFHIVDITNGVLTTTPVFSEASASSGILPVSMAIRPTDGRVFLITTNSAGQAANYVLRQLIGTTLSTVAFPGKPYAMAFDVDGTLWVVDQVNRNIVQLRP